MKVGIKLDIFNDATDETIVAIKHLLYLSAYKNRHVLRVEGNLPKEWEERLDSDQILRLRTADYIFINDETYDCEIMKSGDDYTDRPWFSLDEGIQFLSQPFKVIMENNKNDAMFIDTLIKYYRCTALQIAHDMKWMEYENAGGCTNVSNYIESLMKQCQGKKKFLRCFVILDSDSFYPGHDNPNAAETKRFLQENGIPHHVWEKRMLENYMPEDALPDDDWKRAYIHLSPRQKDYYKIEGGFKKDEHFNKNKNLTTNRSDLLPEQATFYSDVSEANYRKLYEGLIMPNFKDRYPTLFIESPYVNRESLQNRIKHQNNPNEFQNLLDEIVQTMAI